MTPREGVETKCPNYDGHLDRMVRDGRLGFSDIIHFVEGAWGDGYLAGRAAHPAATAREEAWKAMVEACERIYDSASRLSRSARPCRDGHRVDSGVLGEVESDIDDLRAALTLARSTGGKP